MTQRQKIKKRFKRSRQRRNDNAELSKISLRYGGHPGIHIEKVKKSQNKIWMVVYINMF